MDPGIVGRIARVPKVDFESQPFDVEMKRPFDVTDVENGNRVKHGIRLPCLRNA